MSTRMETGCGISRSTRICTLSIRTFSRVSRNSPVRDVAAARVRRQMLGNEMMFRILVPLIVAGSVQASAQTRPPEPAPQNPPLTLAQVTMSPDNTRRAHLQEINLETARKLADACV